MVNPTGCARRSAAARPMRTGRDRGDRAEASMNTDNEGVHG
jgi:hypothetical protein